MTTTEYKKPVRTPGGRIGDDRSTGSRSNGRNWVERTKRGKLPRYIRIVRNALMRQGKPEGTATAIAVSTIKRWARGGGNVSPKVRAAAARALAQWEAMKAEKEFDGDVYTKSSLVPGLDQGDIELCKSMGLDIGVDVLASGSVSAHSEEDGTSGLAAKSNGEEMKIEHKTVGVCGLKVLDEDDGIVETYVSVTGIVDNVKDIIEPGAYQKTLATRTPKGVWSHDWTTPVSKTLEVEELLPGDERLPATLPGTQEKWPENAGALLVKTQFNLGTQRGREAYSDVVFYGDQQEWSIGYNVPAGGATIDQKAGVRNIKALDLFEYSPVLWGAMPSARSAGGVKAAQEAHVAYKNLFGEDYYVKMDTSAVSDFVIEMKDMLGDFSPEDEPLAGLDDLAEGLLDAENKGALSADSVHLVKKAIDALSDLLNSMTGTPDEDAQEEKWFDIEAKELAEIVEQVKSAGLDEEVADELADYAAEFDAAVEDGDEAAIEENASAVLDIVDDNIDSVDGEEAEGLKSIAAAVHDILVKASEPEEDEDDEEDDYEEDEVDDEEEVEEEDDGEKVALDTTEVKSLRDFLDNLS